MHKEKIDKVILCDVDNCLIDWSTTFANYMTEGGYELVDDYHHQFLISDRYGIPYDDGEELVAQFNKTHHIRELEAHRDSVETVAKLVDEGYEFHAITSIGTHEETVSHRENNLKDLFGQDTFSSITCLEVFSDKRPTLSQWEDKKYMWIEDCPRNIEAGFDMGLFPIMISHPYNVKSEVVVPRVSNETPWQEIYDMCQFYYSSP